MREASASPGPPGRAPDRRPHGDPRVAGSRRRLL